jgi:hypothetical protein
MEQIMSVFGNIMSAIFHHSAATAQPASTATKPSTTTPVSPSQTAGAAAPSTAGPTPISPSQTGGAAAPSTAGLASVDVEAVLTKLATQNKEKLDWRRSIVDLMKLLNLDSGLAARKELAKELHYSGNTDDSAAMNVWLQKQVMTKLAENGGKVPDSLRT